MFRALGLHLVNNLGTIEIKLVLTITNKTGIPTQASFYQTQLILSDKMLDLVQKGTRAIASLPIPCSQSSDDKSETFQSPK